MRNQKWSKYKRCLCVLWPLPPSWRGWEEPIWGIVSLIFTFSLFPYILIFFHFLSSSYLQITEGRGGCSVISFSILRGPTQPYSGWKTPQKKLLTGLILPTDLCNALLQDTFAVFVYLVDPHKFVQKLVFDGLAWCWNFRSLDKWYIVIFLFCS